MIKITGIYIITNKINGKSYIGQSENIEKRFYSHKHNKTTELGQDIQKYGEENFSFSILEECKKEDLDRKEIQYISAYGTIYNGYNKQPGGSIVHGEYNPNSKLTENDVYDIREAYNNHERKWKTYEKYKDKITKSYFSNLWEGRSWVKIHNDVFNEQNKQYYKKETSLGQLGEYSSFSDYEVMEFRYQYITKSAKQLYDEYNIENRCSYQSFQQILWGRYYSHLPIYNKRLKRWDKDILII